MCRKVRRPPRAPCADWRGHSSRPSDHAPRRFRATRARLSHPGGAYHPRSRGRPRGQVPCGHGTLRGAHHVEPLAGREISGSTCPSDLAVTQTARSTTLRFPSRHSTTTTCQTKPENLRSCNTWRRYSRTSTAFVGWVESLLLASEIDIRYITLSSRSRHAVVGPYRRKRRPSGLSTSAHS